MIHQLHQLMYKLECVHHHVRDRDQVGCMIIRAGKFIFVQARNNCNCFMASASVTADAQCQLCESEPVSIICQDCPEHMRLWCAECFATHQRNPRKQSHRHENCIGHSAAHTTAAAAEQQELPLTPTRMADKIVNTLRTHFNLHSLRAWQEEAVYMLFWRAMMCL
jgi:hypothetical protein